MPGHNSLTEFMELHHRNEKTSITMSYIHTSQQLKVAMMQMESNK